MEMSRRNVLRSAAVVGGSAAAVPLFTSLAGSAVAGVVSPAGTTLVKTLGPGPAINAGGYRKIVELAGEPHAVRNDFNLTVDANRENVRTPVAAFVQFSDIHIIDHQSPGRVEWLDRFEDPNDLGLNTGLLSSSYRAWEMLSAQVSDAMVQAVNAIKNSSPVLGEELAFMIETGDNSDNCQKNEIRWNIDVLDGKTVRPDSGSQSKYEGPMDNNVWYYDTHYWHPEGTPGGKQPDKLRKDHGWPTVPGLLNTSRQPFDAAGLNIPWYTVFGNHDGLIQGNFPNSTTQLDLLSRGGVKVITVPPGITHSDILNALKKADLLGLLSSINLLPGARLVTPDPARKNLSRKEVVNEYFNTTSSPVGHGYTAANKANGTAYYYFDRDGIRHIAMDTVNPNGYADGSLDQAQFAWIKATVASAEDKAVVLYSHHTSGSMANPLVLTGLDPSLRVLGADLVTYLASQKNVIAWVNGHTHRNEIIAHPGTGESGGFWEINTASHIDYPQQARVIEIADNTDGTLSIFTTIIDHAGPANPGANPTGTLALASLARELSANDPQSNLASLSGTAASRNTELLIARPAGVNLPVPTANGQGSISPVAAAALVGGVVAAKVISRRDEALAEA